MSRIASVSLAVLTLVLSGEAYAERFPDDSGVINVRSFGALGNGKNDDTAALLRAIAASGTDTGPSFWHDRIVYLPKGIYLVSGTLLKRYDNGKFASGLTLVGESQGNTTIRLADKAPGFGDPEHPRAVVFTTSKILNSPPTGGGKNYEVLGEGNDAYMNFVEDLTIDVGQKNPGAVALDFLGNNLDAIRDVTLRAPEGSGAVGLSMTRKWPGPTLVQNVDIHGFQIGIDVAQSEYGITFDGLRLEGQKQVALRNSQNALAIRNVNITGSLPLIRNESEKGLIAIEGGHFADGDGSQNLASYVSNAGVVRVRDLKMESKNGDRKEIASLNGILRGQSEWRVTPADQLLPLGIDSPKVPESNVSYWVNIERYGAAGDPAQDSTDPLKQAFASGAAVVYLPHGDYGIGETLEVPATVQRIVGMNSTLHVASSRRATFSHQMPLVRVATRGTPLVIDKLHFDNTGQGTKVAVEVSGERDVVMRDAVGAGVILVDRKSGGGRTFIENVCCGRFQFAGPQPVFARQLDTEGPGVRISNTGSPLWILGLKTEGVATIVDNRDNAQTNIFGGLIYMVRDGANESVPAFINKNARLSATFIEESLRAGSRYSIYADHESALGKRTVPVTDFPERGFGRIVPLLSLTPDN